MEKHRTDETSNTKTRVDSCYLPRCLHSREIGEKQWLVNFQNIAKINCWTRFSLKKPLPHWVLSGVFSSKLSFEIPSLDHCKYALNWLSLKQFFNDHLGSSKKEKDREKSMTNLFSSTPWQMLAVLQSLVFLQRMDVDKL